MLIVLLIFALIRALRGVPLASPSEPPDPFPALALRDTQSHFGQRTVNDIIISCFVTIFACTWSAIHPNIPAVTDSKWTCFKRQVTITICALLAPELMTGWAMRQRIAAKEIMDEYNKDINGLTLDSGQITLLEKLKGWFQGIFPTICGVFHDSPLPPPLKEGQGPQWTLAHGFFLQMGGFMICENGRPIQVLIDGSRESNKNETRLIWNIQQKVINPPRITEDDIKDRSKGDAISKTFIILQTTWFIVQCIARWSQHLPVTELEVVTLGFAMLNGITYIAWWDKPQNVGRPVFLECKKPPLGDTSERSVEPSTTANTTSDDAEAESNPLQRLPVRELDVMTLGFAMLNGTYIAWWDKPQNIGRPVFLEIKKTFGDTNETSVGLNIMRTDNSTSEGADRETESNSILRPTEPNKESWPRRKLRQEMTEHARSPRLLWRLPLRILQALGRPLWKMLDSDTAVTARNIRVEMFYAAQDTEDDTGYAIFAIGVVFGAVHLIPSWFPPFSSPQEMWLWRVSAIIITTASISSGLGMYCSDHKHNFLMYVFGVFALAGSVLYPIARIILLTLSLTALRSLPSGALLTIEWTTFIPHL